MMSTKDVLTKTPCVEVDNFTQKAINYTISRKLFINEKRCDVFNANDPNVTVNIVINRLNKFISMFTTK